MIVKEMVHKWLDERHYDGLFNVDGDCACGLTELIPCEQDCSECQSGYKYPCPDDCGDHEFHISAEKPKKRRL